MRTGKKAKLYIIGKMAALGAAITLLCAGCDSSLGEDKPIDAAALSEQVTAQVVAGIEDRYDAYAHYYTPEEYEERFTDLMGAFGGIGIYMTDMDGHVVLYSVKEEGPAHEAGVFTPGDIILAVDGEDVTGQDSSYVSNLIRGEIGTAVTVKMQRVSDGQYYSATLIRETIVTQTVAGMNLEDYPGVAYIQIASFSLHTAADFAELFNELNGEQPITGLILDLRSNGGGEFTSAINIAEFFIPEEEIIVVRKLADGLNVHRSESGALVGLPCAVLQNSFTASASEVLAGSLQESADAALIGSVSFGKGVTQNVARLHSGSGHAYTNSIYYTASGFSLHGVGLTPDIEVPDPENITSEEYFSEDPAQNPHLAAALRYLGYSLDV